jgi:hypothetical protein
MTDKKQTPPSPKKRPYREPKLKVHGNLRALTTVKSGNMDDGGVKPNTRAAGSQA